MDTSDNGQELILTLRTPEGLAFVRALKSWQIEGMATIATYGKPGSPQPRIDALNGSRSNFSSVIASVNEAIS